MKTKMIFALALLLAAVPAGNQIRSCPPGNVEALW